MAKSNEAERTEKLMLFKDNDKYRDDLFVCVNGRSYLIQRGVEVEVPWFVAEVIKNAMKAESEAMERLKNVIEEYQAP